MQLERNQLGKTRTAAAATGGVSRRDFLRTTVALPALGALYFGYEQIRRPVRAAIVGTGNEGCEAMIAQSPPGYLEYVAFHDIRPSQVARARKQFVKLYGKSQGRRVRYYDDYAAMLADPNVEAVVIATPLSTHAKLAIEAMKAGKHVFCEKLMAHNVAECKEMVRAADEHNKLLAIGHQRHYSTLYADAVRTIQSGVLGEVRHVQALWHRNNARMNPATGKFADSWRPDIPVEDTKVDFKKYGYKSLEELIRWRLYDRTGGGLMAELGSHQLDACSLFVGKVHPISVYATGGRNFFTDDRECEDHVYCIFEFPKGVTVTYSSINTNSIEGYGETVLGTKGAMIVAQERETAVYPEPDPFANQRGPKKVEVKVGSAAAGQSTMYSAASVGATTEAVKNRSSGEAVSRGYREELEHFAFCVRHRDPANHVHCDGKQGLADAVMALAANVAIRSGKRVEFRDTWFDPASPDGPEKKA